VIDGSYSRDVMAVVGPFQACVRACVRASRVVGGWSLINLIARELRRRDV